jgi:chorismate dehydratase
MSYKVSIVNYLNSAIFVEGLKIAEGFEIDIFLDFPADSAKKLLQNEVDIALAPVAIIPLLPFSKIISDFCIGSNGEVGTVKIFSEVPIQEVQTIYLDYQSRTSVQLAKILCQYKWNIQPELLPAFPGFQKDIVGNKAGLIIGDRAVRVLGKYKYEYDLGKEWTDWQGLPFVYATWIANKEIDEDWLLTFNRHLAEGWKKRPEIIKRYQHLNTPLFSVETYLNQNIDYILDDSKRKGLETYLNFLKSLDNN